MSSGQRGQPLQPLREPANSQGDQLQRTAGCTAFRAMHQHGVGGTQDTTNKNHSSNGDTRYGRPDSCGLQTAAGVRRGASPRRERVHVCNPPSNSEVEFRPRHFWLAQLLTPPEGIDSVVWKTRHALPPDCNAGTYCCKIQWFQRVTVDSRRFRLASAQYISLSCIVPIQFPIVLSQKGKKQFVLSVDTQEKILKTMTGLVIDD